MDLLRVFQQVKSPVIGENVLDLKEAQCFKESLVFKEENTEKYKQKILDLEQLVAKLREENAELQRANKESDESKTNLTGVIVSYENMLEKLVKEHHIVKGERDLVKTHLANLELAFHDLVEKYERAKTIITGFENNEKTFKTHVENYEQSIAKIEKKYNDFKSYAIDKLNEANQILKKNDREYLQEVAKLKAKIIQSQIKINELERQVSRMFIKNGETVKNESFIFEPLVNNIS
ncbi:Transforming acidic coiled-coil-containing protein (TACC), C-terminal [Popillia japonica]|uniref:Transforming acidic coiled-coil-containing protein (TACC), C-terminal n=1 Tax=Popillia japonica TaxID=7064 RepID=A0AAW1MLL0_POPJA